MNKNYNVDYINNTVTFTASFLRKASTLGTKEYNEMIQLRRDLPGCRFEKAVVATGNRKANDYKNMTYDNMHSYIETVAENKEDAKAKIDAFERVRKLSKVQANPYKYVADWFKKEYPDCKPEADKKKSGTTSNNSEADEKNSATTSDNSKG